MLNNYTLRRTDVWATLEDLEKWLEGKDAEKEIKHLIWTGHLIEIETIQEDTIAVKSNKIKHDNQ